MQHNLDAAARGARRLGDGRTLDQLRTDIAVGWLTEGAFGTLVIRPSGAADRPVRRARSPVPPPREAEVELARPPSALIVISMPATTALGLNDSPATLFGPDGPMPLPAPLARQIAHDPAMSTWLGLFTDPRTGVATDISPNYRPPPRQRTFVTLRDGLRSRLPGSNARRLELDHIVSYDHGDSRRGGQTMPANLVTVGLREHHLKTDGALAVTGDANDGLTYTTHTGHAYVSWPEEWEAPSPVVDLNAVLPRPAGPPIRGEPPF